MVTVEVAFGIPVVVAMALLGAWLVGVGSVHVQLTAAAADAARELARGASTSAVLDDVAARIPGADVTAEVDPGGALVTVMATSRVVPLRGWWGDATGVTLTATGRAVLESP